MGHDNASKSSTANDVTANLSSTPAVGKKPLTAGLSPGPTGDTYIDHGAICERGGAAGVDCFLSAAQRGRLISELQMRILDAGSHYVAAAEATRIDKLMEKDEDIPLVLGIVFDIATAYFSARAIAALAKLKTNLTSALDSDPFAIDYRPDTRFTELARSAVGKVAPTHIAAGVGATFAQSKAQVIAQVKRETNAPTTDKRGAAVSYLEQLTNDTQLAFADLRQSLPANANDAELLAWRTAFEPKEHTVRQYKAAIAEKLTRFENSDVRRIGRDQWHSEGSKASWNETDEWMQWQQRGSLDKVDRDSPRWREQYHDAGIYVVWKTYASGSPKELVYQWRGRSDPGNTFAGEGHIGPRHGGSAPEYRDMTPVVPPEFQDFAIARHTQVWGSAPGTEIVDDSTWYWAPDRAKKAEENKAKDPFLIPATSLDDLTEKSKSRTGLPKQAPTPAAAPAAPQRPVPRLDLTGKRDDGVDRGGDPEPGDFK